MIRKRKYNIVPNLLNLDFTAAMHNQERSVTISDFWIRERWLQVTVILDLFSHRSTA